MRLNQLFAFIILVTFLSLYLLACNIDQKSVQDTERRLVGIKLSLQTLKLVTDVEQHYKKKIREELKDDLRAYARSTIDVNGTPVIQVKASILPNEAVLVHELLHLKMYADGFPMIDFEARQGGFTENDLNYLQFVLAHVYDSIQHYSFFPKMRAQGFHPDEQVRTEFDQVLLVQDYENYPGITPFDVRTIFYFKAVMNIDDNLLLERIQQWYLRNNWSKSLTVSKRLVEMVTSSKTGSPSELVAVFMNCLQFIQKPGMKFAFRGWKTQKLGDHTQTYAVIDIQA